MGTVHAFCLLHVLGPFGWRLGASFGAYEVASEREMADARQSGLDAANINEDQRWWTSKLSTYRQIVKTQPARRHEFDDRLPTVAAAYRRALRAAKRIDFDDIVLLSLKLIEEHEHVRRVLVAKFPWFVVDEYQDLGYPLHRIVTALVDAGVQVFVVGDPDQSIYGFNGARPEFLDAMAARADMETVRLRINYRCRQQIIDTSLHVLQPESEREFSAIVDPDAPEGEIVLHECGDGLEQQADVAILRIEELLAAGVKPGDIGILGPRWDDLAPFMRRLGETAIPFRLARGNQYKATRLTEWVEDMARWCAGGWMMGSPRLRHLFATWDSILRSCRAQERKTNTLEERVLLYRVVSGARRPELPVKDWFVHIDDGLGLSALVANAERIPPRFRHDIRELKNMIAAMVASSQSIAEFSGISRDKVVLQTIHGSKGLEYTAVFIPALEEGVLPRTSGDDREARRLFYVALTRARHEVHLLWSGFWHTAKGYRRDDGPSRFLDEIVKRLEVE